MTSSERFVADVAGLTTDDEGVAMSDAEAREVLTGLVLEARRISEAS
jgi:hypothetical protein